MNTKRLVVAGYIDGPWQRIDVDPAFGNVELWDHEMADFISLDFLSDAASERFGAMLQAMIGDDDDRYDGSIEEDYEDIRRGY